ncbi:hypothetical protein HMPREF3185_00929, partial [Porphyromonas somerae]
CLVFKTTYIDTEKPLREGAFFFMSRTLFPPLDKRNTCDKAQGLPRCNSRSHSNRIVVFKSILPPYGLRMRRRF